MDTAEGNDQRSSNPSKELSQVCNNDLLYMILVQCVYIVLHPCKALIFEGTESKMCFLLEIDFTKSNWSYAYI